MTIVRFDPKKDKAYDLGDESMVDPEVDKEDREALRAELALDKKEAAVLKDQPEHEKNIHKQNNGG